MTTAVEVSGQAPEEESHPRAGESKPPHDGLCKNERCKKGPNGTRGIVKSRRANYCSAYCRVDVCRREATPRPAPMEKPSRKPRSDRKYPSHAERQRAYQARHSTAGWPQGIKDLLG